MTATNTRRVVGGRVATIGVLGGMGPAATVDFYRRVVAATSAACDQDHLHVIIDSDPSVPDRTAFLLGAGADPVPALVRMARRLEIAGADMLVLACNTANAFREAVAAAVRVGVLDWPDQVARGLAHELPSRSRIGLLATTGTVSSGLYQQTLARHGLEATAPGPVEQARLMEAIYGPGGVKAESANLAAPRALLRSVCASMSPRVDAMLLACTELSLLTAGDDPPQPVPVFDAADLAAEGVVRQARSA